MNRTPYIVIAIFLVLLIGTLVLAGVLYFDKKAEEAKGNTAIIDSGTTAAIQELQKQAQSDMIANKNIDDIGLYNRLSECLNEFYESIYYKEYKYSYSYLNKDYAEYMDIKNEKDFIDFVDAKGLGNLSGDILNYIKIADNTYLLTVATIARNTENMFSSPDEFYMYLQDRKSKAESIVLSIPDDDNFTIALDGFLYSTIATSQAQANGLFITTNKIISFNDHTVIRLNFKNEGNNTLMLGSVFKSIVARDSSGNYVYADAIDNTIDNEVVKGETNTINIIVRNGETEIRSLEFNFIDGMTQNSVIMEF